MIRVGAVPKAAIAALVRGDALAAMEDLDRAAGGSQIDLLPDQAVGNGVEIAVILEMVFDAGAGQAPLGELAILGQRRRGRPLDGLEEMAAGHSEAPDDMVVVPVDGRADRRIGLGLRKEGLVAQAAQDGAPVAIAGLVATRLRSGHR